MTARVALVAGGTGALGQSVVLRLLKDGAAVAVPWIVPEEWEALRSRARDGSARLHGAKVDVTGEGAVAAFVTDLLARHQRLDVLVNTVGGFAGGAFAPILRRVDKFLKGRFPKTLEEREERAELVRAADEALVDVVAKIKKRGINHPYVKNFVLARTTPLTRERKTLPSFDQTFKRLVDNIEGFDVAKVRYEDIQRSAIMGAPAAG